MVGSSTLSGPVRRLLTGRDDGMADWVAAIGESGDDGLFGPGSVCWQVMSCPATLVAGVRALLVQALDPLTVAGVMRHSRFRDDAVGRLQATARFVTVVSFASTGQAHAECAKVTAIHRRVSGTLPDGRTFSAADPVQLRFVHLALVESFLAAHQAYAPVPLPAASVDRFVVEWNVVAPLLGFDTVPLPATRDELQMMLADDAERFVFGDDARAAAGFLADPPLPRPMRAGYRRVLRAAAVSLPESFPAGMPAAAGEMLASLGVPAGPSRRTWRSGRVLVRLLTWVLGPSPAYVAACHRTGTPPVR